MEENFEYGHDGWPSCPHCIRYQCARGNDCGGDTLISLHYSYGKHNSSAPPLLGQYLKFPLRCTCCGWEGVVPYPKPWQRE